MKEFYEDILQRNPKDTTPLEKVVLWECAQEKGYNQLHLLRIQQMMEDISERRAQAESSDGCDWVIATFEGLLERALTYGDHMPKEDMLSLPPHELSMRRTAQRNQPAAEAYEYLKAGMPCQNSEAERRLLRLYESIIARTDAKAFRPDVAHVQTLKTLMDTHNRVFRQDLTGLIRYRYYDRSRLLGTATTQVIPDFPTVIHCGGLVFSSSFDPETTVVPGMFRNIVDADDPTKLAARLTWKDFGLHEFDLYWDKNPMTVQIRREEEIFKFHTENRCIAESISLPGDQRLMEWELCAGMKFHEELPVETQVLLMSFPLLSVGL